MAFISRESSLVADVDPRNVELGFPADEFGDVGCFGKESPALESIEGNRPVLRAKGSKGAVIAFKELNPMKNLHLLAADIVSRVQHSPDSSLNLAQLVEGLIRQHGAG